MYLPRNLISHLYNSLLKSHHPLSPPVLILVALEPDALCACRILASLLKRDYIPHKIQPISGYGDLAKAGEELVRPLRLADGGSGGVVVCLGVGGLVDLESVLGLEVEEDGTGGADGVDIWVFDARRPWNLANVFGGFAQARSEEDTARKQHGVERGQLQRNYKPGQGGIVVFDDGDIEEELDAEREAWYALEEMPEVEDDGEESDDSDAETEAGGESGSLVTKGKRKSWSDREEEEGDSGSEKENRPAQRRRSNSSSPIPSSPSRYNMPSSRSTTPPSNQLSSYPAIPEQPSARTLRRRLLRLRRKHDATLRAYHTLGTSYSEPISSLMYSLASELGREDNDLLWLAIIGVSSNELYGRTPTGLSLTNHDLPSVFTGWAGSRGSRIRQILRDEVRRLNPPELTETGREVIRGHAADVIPTHARTPTDNAIRLSPEPRFLLLRHWSLYDSMLHSPYLSAKLHVWSDAGRRRLHKLLAKMGVSLTQCRQSYVHMDVELKRLLREKLLHFAPQYGLEGLVPPASSGRAADQEGWGFVRAWGWKACLSAADVAVVVGAMLEVGASTGVGVVDGVVGHAAPSSLLLTTTTTNASATSTSTTAAPATDSTPTITRFYAAYDALLSPTALVASIPLAQSLHRAILRTGTALLQKRQIRHLRAFRMAIVKDGPDVPLFCHPGALTKLALWVGEAVGEAEKDDAHDNKGKSARRGFTPLVLGCMDEARDVCVVVGLGGGGGEGGKRDAEGDAAAAADDGEKQRKKAAKAEAKGARRDARLAEKEERRLKRREASRRRRRRAAADDSQDDESGDNDDAAAEDSDATESSASSSSSSDSDSDSGSGSDSDTSISSTSNTTPTADPKISSTTKTSRRRRGKARKPLLNAFGPAFQSVVAETGARVRLDSFEHCVVEVRREDLGGFLEALSLRAVVG